MSKIIALVKSSTFLDCGVCLLNLHNLTLNCEHPFLLLKWFELTMMLMLRVIINTVIVIMMKTVIMMMMIGDHDNDDGCGDHYDDDDDDGDGEHDDDDGGDHDDDGPCGLLEAFFHEKRSPIKVLPGAQIA